MAQTSLLAIQDQGNYAGEGTYQRKFVITLADIQGIGAATSGDILLENLPPKCSVVAVMTKHSVAVTGTGPFSACTCVVKTANNATLGGAAFDVFQAIGATVSQQTYPAALKENFAAITPLLATIAITGGNASVALTGNIEIYVTYRVLPA